MNISSFAGFSLNGKDLVRLELGGRTIWTKPPAYRYKMVEYLEFFGDGHVDTQFIQENVVGTAGFTMGLELDYETQYDVTTQRVYVSGATDGTDYVGAFAYIQYQLAQSNNTAMLLNGQSSAMMYYPTLSAGRAYLYARIRPTYMRQEVVSGDGKLRIAEAAITGNVALGMPIYIGSCNGTDQRSLIGKIYNAWFGSYASSVNPITPTTRLADMMPAVAADGSVGMYDTLRDVFCRAYGTVTPGPETGEVVL